MKAVQELRRKAKDTGNLKTTPQQTVTTQGTGSQTTIIVQPANPQVVYVPTYNPTVVYGAPVPVYPGYSGADVAAVAIISFGVGMMIGRPSMAEDVAVGDGIPGTATGTAGL